MSNKMSIQIQNYVQPGAYSTIIPNPTVAVSTGVPVVAIVGQSIRGPYTPQLFFNFSDAQTYYGTATKGNPLSLGIQLAFQNGAPRVLGLNVQPDNSLSAGINILISTLPVSGYVPAPPGAIDQVTQKTVDPDGTIAGSFYVQDYNPVVADPVYNSNSASVQAAFFNSGNRSMLQYVQLLGATKVPLANTASQQVIVYAVQPSSPPLNTITQAQWNQYTNASTLLNAINGAYLSPVAARILIPDSGYTGYNPIPGFRDIDSVLGATLNAGTANAITIPGFAEAYNYAIHNGGILNIYSIEPGTQHQVIYGLFDSNSASTSSTNGQGFGLPVQNGVVGNPFNQLPYGTDGVITTTSYINAIAQLAGQRADVIVVLNTDPSIQGILKAHVAEQSGHDYRNERIAIVSGPISELYTTTIQNVTVLQGGPGAQRMMYIYPTSAFFFDQVLNTTVALDGTYLACACAGLLTSNNAAEPLTHKVLSGFRDVGVKLNNRTANGIAKNGVCIIENSPNFGIRVRDQLTCDPTSPETQEISVVRQLDFTAQTLRDVMEANVVATKISRGTIGTVQGLAVSALKSLEDSKVIYGFKDVVARINPNDPRRIDLSCTVRPSYPCKFVEITIQVTSSLAGF